MKKPAPADQPADSTAQTGPAALPAPAAAAPQDPPSEGLPPEDPAPEAPTPEIMPAAGGSYVRLPDGTLQREEEA